MPDLVLPAAALAVLTIALYFVQAAAATRAVMSGAIGRDAVIYPGSASGPDWLERPRRNYLNLVEMPVLFYAAIAVEIARGAPDGAQIALAWTYVGLRFAHTIVHLIANPVLVRFLIFSASAAVLAIMWARIALSAL